MSLSLYLCSLFQDMVMAPVLFEEEGEMGGLPMVILTEGALVMNIVGMGFCLHTSRRMIQMR